MDHANGFDGKTFDVNSKSQTAIASLSFTCGIAMMAKASTPGRAKTRLVPPLTFDEAAALNTAFLQDMTDNMLLASQRAAPQVAIAAYAAYGPPGSENFFRATLPASVGLIAAWLPNFGDCLMHTVCEIFARGHAAAVVLNSDSPTLPTALLNETAEALALPGDRAVLGPSTDGGYYLLGLKAAHPRMFEDIAWSTERVAEQTRERAREIDLEIHELPLWYDVDDVEGLRRVRDEIGRSVPQHDSNSAHQPHHSRHTAALMNGLWRQRDFSERVDGVGQAERMSA